MFNFQCSDAFQYDKWPWRLFKTSSGTTNRRQDRKSKFWKYAEKPVFHYSLDHAIRETKSPFAKPTVFSQLVDVPNRWETSIYGFGIRWDFFWWSIFVKILLPALGSVRQRLEKTHLRAGGNRFGYASVCFVTPAIHVIFLFSWRWCHLDERGLRNSSKIQHFAIIQFPLTRGESKYVNFWHMYPQEKRFPN